MANPDPTTPLDVRSGLTTADGTSFELPVDGEVSYLLRMAGDQWVLGAYPEGAGREFQVLVVDSSGSVLSLSPNSRSNTARGLFSIGTGVVGLLQQSVLL